MNREQRRVAARRAGLPTRGLGGEIVDDAIMESRRDMRGATGVEPAELVNVEHVTAINHGHGVLLTFDTPTGRRCLLVSPDDADTLGVRLRDCADSARRGLFVARG